MVTVVLSSECQVSDCPTRIVVQCGTNEMQPRSTSRMLPPPGTAATFVAGFSAGLALSADFSAALDVDFPADFEVVFAALFSPVLASLAPPASCVAFCDAPPFSVPPVAAPFCLEPQPPRNMARHRASAPVAARWAHRRIPRDPP